jgi:hypothetical protein
MFFLPHQMASRIKSRKRGALLLPTPLADRTEDSCQYDPTLWVDSKRQGTIRLVSTTNVFPPNRAAWGNACDIEISEPRAFA